MKESMSFMFNYLEFVDNMVVQNVINYKNYLQRSEINLEESEFWELENIYKMSWILLVSAEMLKAHEKVIHKKVLMSKNKAEVVADTLESLSIDDWDSKITQMSELCVKVFKLMNKLKNVQGRIMKFSKKTIDVYMIIERSFLSFINDFWYIYFLCEQNESALKMILQKIGKYFFDRPRVNFNNL